jgi:hypothetical protein
MRICKRILAGLTLVLSAIGLLLSLTVGAGVWIVREPVTTRSTRVFERIDGALDVADDALEQVKTSLARAEKNLEDARAKQSAQAPATRTDTARRFLARTVQRQVAPELGDAREKLHAVAEAAVVVNSILEDAGNFPLASAAGLDRDRLAEINNRLGEVGPRVWELSRLLGESDAAADAAASNELSLIERALKAMQELVADYALQLAQVRQRTEALKARILPSIMPATVLISFAGCWIALSQVSLLCHASRWWKRSDRNESYPPSVHMDR